ncbi:iron chelate uptake ABC transporter family permease subunit [Paenibacillus aceris]|uniref:Iron complex transport system permease protein n=1 Tax=Paenibacillus aceris TaxID=869555 RepID=A0ABS4I5C1_9BACL|nr:iron chelate uptake ABC transporter family permease subunit [Paenibacillus aceris]MBP1966118.1 iron complex transport system permease protein [Paenibacillus aceris]NHW39657.1 iron chelate uptake ABC transporter family permease subunit [Paenibacillus aceris]
MTFRWKLSLLAIVALGVTAAFLTVNAGGNWDYILPRRGSKVISILLTGAAIAYSTILFQTITNNRILTPSIIGLDALYMLIQTTVIFLLGSKSALSANVNMNFVITVGLMSLFALLLFKFLFKSERRNLYFLLLFGIILGTFFGSFTTFMEVLIDPNEYAILQSRSFASFNNVNSKLLLISVISSILIGLYSLRFLKYLDVISLGREHAVNLGVPYEYVVKRLLIIIAVLVSIATALVGPVTFLGLLVANLSYQFMKTHRHRYLIPGSILISVIALVGGQLIMERIFSFSTPLAVIINFVGGVYFLYLLLRENKS